MPGTNGPNFYEGGTPLFDLDTYADLGTTDTFMPYFRSDDQLQMVFNTSWTKGHHNVRFGTDIYYQALNHTQPEISGGDSLGARGGFRFQAGPTQLQGGAAGNFYNAFAAFLLGTPNRIGRLGLAEPYTTRNWQYSLYVRDQWQPTSKMTLSYGTRWEYFPVPRRATRGLERYDVNTNMMMVGGVGSVPMDLGVDVSKTMFAPRLGFTYRITEKNVVRAGFGITNDPYSLARPMRTNHPAVLNLILDSTGSLTYRQPDGRRHSGHSGRRSGKRHHPGAGSPVTVFTLADKFERGYIQSFNVAFQRELGRGFAAEAAYVGTRQINQLGFRELNWSPIGGGNAGRQLNRQFGRTGQTKQIAPVGDSEYDSLQTRLTRRFQNGFQFGVSYTLSKSEGVVSRQRQFAAHQHPGLLRPQLGDQQLRSHPQPAHHRHLRAALRAGPAVAANRCARAHRRWLAGQHHPELLQRHAVRRQRGEHVVERARVERPARRPGERRRRDSRGHRSRQSVLRSTGVQACHRSPLRDRALQPAPRTWRCAMGPQRLPAGADWAGSSTCRSGSTPST